MKDNNAILYVDDEIINLRVFEISLKKKYRIITASPGLDALQVLQADDNIDIVVSDMKMPGMNGIEFISEAKKRHGHLKFFILTGFEINEDILQALKSGLILKYFRKPIDIKDLTHTLDEIRNAS